VLLYEDLSGLIIGAAMEVHKALGPGFLEAVYENALVCELKIREVPFAKQDPLLIFYKNLKVGTYRPDLLVDGKIIVEVKGLSSLISVHEAQALNYLAATGLRLALLINFGAKSLQFRRIIR
jgi:GxxExxY protein